MTEPIPQSVARKLQLAMFAGGEPDGQLLEVRYRRPQGTVRRLGFFDARKLDELSAEIESTAATADVWVGAAPRDREDGTANGVSSVHCLWVDLDSHGALARLAAFRPLPAIVVRSGSPDCAHAYWALRSAVSPAAAQRACRRLALALGGDMNATDPARILRPAGTRNFKHARPTPVVCTRLECDACALEEVVGGLPDSDHYRPRRVHASREAAGYSTSSSLDGLLRAVREAPIGSRNATCFWAACRAVDEGHDAREELRQAALDAGLPEFEVERTLDSAERRVAA